MLNNKAFDFVEHEVKTDKLIAKLFNVSFMSNAKWRKCFKSLDFVSSDLQVIWKFVGSNNDGVRHALPSLDSLEETYLSSRFWFGPAYYKEIEWIEFIKVVKPAGMEEIPGSFIEQDISIALNTLNDLGKFQIENTEKGFRLYGYK